MADDYVEEVIRHYRPILARAGDTLTCPNGHAVADIVRDVRLGDRLVPAMFANWRSREGWSPRAGDPRTGTVGNALPMCPVCRGNPWHGPQDDLRLRTQHGFRGLPGDPADEMGVGSGPGRCPKRA